MLFLERKDSQVQGGKRYVGLRLGVLLERISKGGGTRREGERKHIGIEGTRVYHI